MLIKNQNYISIKPPLKSLLTFNLGQTLKFPF